MTAVILIYGLTSLILILHLFTGRAVLGKASTFGLLLSAAAHLVYTIHLGMKIGEAPITTVPQAVNMMILAASFIFSAAVLWKNAHSLGVFFAPFATFILSIISGSLGTSHVLIAPSKFWFWMHTLSVLAGDTLFMVSGIASIAYLVHEALIKRGSIHNAASNLPPLVFLDKMIAAALSAGFVAISAGMIIGGLWASVADLRLSSMAPKIAIGAVTWLILAFTLHQRFAIGWRGRRTAIMILAGIAATAILTIIIEILFPEAHGLRMLS